MTIAAQLALDDVASKTKDIDCCHHVEIKCPELLQCLAVMAEGAAIGSAEAA
jgi:hypothetical protein